MQNVLDCSILNDGLLYLSKVNCEVESSIKYRFLFKNKSVLGSNDELSTWYKWYTFVYCKPSVCYPTQETYCNIGIQEVLNAYCTTPLIITEI